MIKKIYLITVCIMAFFAVHSAQSMRNPCYEDQFFSWYKDIEKQEDHCKNVQNVEKEKPKVFNEKSIYFSMSDSGCLDDAQKTEERSSLYESIVEDDFDGLVEIIDEIEDAQKKKEAARFDEYIKDNFLVIPPSNRTMTNEVHLESDKNFVKEVKKLSSLVVMDDYQNTSTNAVATENISDAKEVTTTSVIMDCLCKLTTQATDKLVQVNNYLHELNKDTTTYTNV